MSEVEQTFLIINARGLHARAATSLARLCENFQSTVVVKKDGQTARASSVIELLLLCGQPGSEVCVCAEGDDADAAVRAVGELIGDRFGEDS